KKSAADGLTVHPHPAGAAIVSVPDPPAGPNAAGDTVDSNPHGSVNTAAAFQVPGPEVTSVVLDDPLAAICLSAPPAWAVSTRYTGVPDASCAKRPPLPIGLAPTSAPSAAFSSCTS